MNVRSDIHPRGRGRPGRVGGRDALLDAALGLFAERGFHGTSIPEIAAAASMAPATIYRHVVGKEDLVNQVYRRCKTALGAALIARVPPSAPLRERFDALWTALDRFARDEPRAFAFLELHHHGGYLDAESRAIELRVLAPIAAVVEHGLATGALRGGSAPALIITVWGAFVGMIRAARTGYVTHDASLSAEVAACAWAAIRAPARTSP